ncbi:amp-dependent synthetase and ligase [Heliomicrobium modesticaldum Ice1]|uniref:Amp-dependent synthetase and ligase n=1 Tax=Heliobacterium modesticaldum (strain ATCC 51547 / Ice1) TaxID=498761 RepID=B0TH04_HELMI|nr:AMP-binding protein [Heliomicrobium modesticaldum]ABZ83329.1 amp-dependent synthetase and ligase [Heliomicrobium modesticaldum Ice1]
MFLGWMLETMASREEQEALVWNGRSYTYRWLLARIGQWQERLDWAASPQREAKAPVTAGMVVAVEGDYSPNVCALLLALVDRGAIVVPLTRSVRHLREEFLAIAEVQLVISFSDTDEAVFAWKLGDRWVGEGGAPLVGNEAVVPSDDSALATPTNPLLLELIRRGHPGLVLFSSGSTGKSKAVLHDMTLLLKKFQVRRQGKRMLTFLLLDHIGGINTLLYVLSNAGTIVTVPGRSPEAVCANIARYRVEVLPTSPTFLNLLLLSEAYKQADLSSLELITYGTEVMPESTLVRLREALPHVRLQQTYGLSELGILRSKSKASDSLFVKIGGEGFETKVVDGVLWIRAESAMMGYLNAPSPFDEEGWFNTHDEVIVDGEYLRILGRRSEIINVGGEKVFPAEVESVIMEMDNIADVAVSGERSPLTGQMVVAHVVLKRPEEAAVVKKRLRQFCRSRLAPYKVPVKVTVVEGRFFSERFKKMRKDLPG